MSLDTLEGQRSFAAMMRGEARMNKTQYRAWIRKMPCFGCGARGKSISVGGVPVCEDCQRDALAERGDAADLKAFFEHLYRLKGEKDVKRKQQH